MDPHNHHAYMILGQHYLDTQNHAQALTAFQNAHQISPTIYSFQGPSLPLPFLPSSFILGLVDTHLAMHHHKESFLIARDLLKLAKDHSKALELMGTVFYMTNDVEKARSMFLKALERDPKNVSVVMTVVDVYCANEKYEDAIAL